MGFECFLEHGRVNKILIYFIHIPNISEPLECFKFSSWAFVRSPEVRCNRLLLSVLSCYMKFHPFHIIFSTSFLQLSYNEGMRVPNSSSKKARKLERNFHVIWFWYLNRLLSIAKSMRQLKQKSLVNPFKINIFSVPFFFIPIHSQPSSCQLSVPPSLRAELLKNSYVLQKIFSQWKTSRINRWETRDWFFNLLLNICSVRRHETEQGNMSYSYLDSNEQKMKANNINTSKGNMGNIVCERLISFLLMSDFYFKIAAI